MEDKNNKNNNRQKNLKLF